MTLRPRSPETAVSLYNRRRKWYHFLNIRETVDAEITVMMLLQRAGGAESPVENKSSNGPPRVQSKAFGAEYSAT